MFDLEFQLRATITLNESFLEVILLLPCLETDECAFSDNEINRFGFKLPYM